MVVEFRWQFEKKIDSNITSKKSNITIKLSGTAVMAVEVHSPKASWEVEYDAD